MLQAYYDVTGGLADRILDTAGVCGKLNVTVAGLEHTETKLYVIIDEYDNFTNTILAESGLAAYEDVHKIETILSVRRKEET
jgi:hypothetical protein